MQSAEKKPGRSWFRRTLLQIQLGGLLGLVGWMLLGSSILSWRYAPAGEHPSACAPTVQSVLGDFTNYQILSAAGGAAIALLVGGLGGRSRRSGAGKNQPAR